MRLERFAQTLVAASLVACHGPEPFGPSSVAVPRRDDVSGQGTLRVGRWDCPPDPIDPFEVARAELRRTDALLVHTVPDADVTIEGIVCRAKQGVWSDRAGKVRACTVARGVTVHGLELAADDYARFHENGRPYQVHPARATVQTTASGIAVPCAANALMVLSPKGALEHCDLERTSTFGSITLRPERIAFHPSGELWAGVVDQSFSAVGLTFPPGSDLSWNADGTFEGATLQAPTEVKGLRIQSSFTLHKNGALHEVVLAAPHSFAGMLFPRGATLSFRDGGTVERAEYVSDEGFMIHGEPWEDTRRIRFDCHDQIASDVTERSEAPSGVRHAP